MCLLVSGEYREAKFAGRMPCALIKRTISCWIISLELAVTRARPWLMRTGSWRFLTCANGGELDSG